MDDNQFYYSANIDGRSQYDPAHIVVSTHNILHLSPDFNVESNTFNLTYNNYWNDYSKSLLPIPIFAMGLGFIGVLILQLFLLCRICFPIFRCLPSIVNKENASAVTIGQTMKPIRTRLKIFFFITAFLVFAVTQLIIWGKAELVTGVLNSNDSLDYLSNLFTTLDNYGIILNNFGADFSTEFTEASQNGCIEAQALEQALPMYYSYVNDYTSLVDPIPEQISSASDGIHEYAISTISYAAWSLYSALVVAVFMQGVGYYFRQKYLIYVVIWYSELLMLALFFVGAVEMILLMGLSDFCMQPLENINLIVPESVKNMTAYYTTCYGTNPVAPYVEEALSLSESLQVEIDNLLATTCQNNIYLEQSLNTANQVDWALGNISSLIYCPPTQSQLADLIQTSVCTTSFKGFYTIWLSQYVACSLLFLLTIITSLIYQFFGNYWDDADESYDFDMIFNGRSINLNASNSTENYFYSENVENPARNFEPLLVRANCSAIFDDEIYSIQDTRKHILH